MKKSTLVIVLVGLLLLALWSVGVIPDGYPVGDKESETDVYLLLSEQSDGTFIHYTSFAIWTSQEFKPWFRPRVDLVTVGSGYLEADEYALALYDTAILRVENDRMIPIAEGRTQLQMRTVPFGDKMFAVSVRERDDRLVPEIEPEEIVSN